MTDEKDLKSVSAGNFFNGLTPLPKDSTVTMAYVPFQTDLSVYDTSDALNAGTLFKSLNKPFLRGALR